MESYKIPEENNYCSTTNQKNRTWHTVIEINQTSLPNILNADSSIPVLNTNAYGDTILLITLKELATEIRANLNGKKAPEFDLIKSSILKKF